MQIPQKRLYTVMVSNNETQMYGLQVIIRSRQMIARANAKLQLSLMARP